MSRDRPDAAPRVGYGKRLAAGAKEAPSAARVADYLRQHPDFLCQHPGLLDVLTPPGRDRGNGVADLQQFMVESLRRNLAEMTAARDALVTTGRHNLSAQARLHKAILALLGARNLEHFIEVLTVDLAAMLDLDVATIGVERCDGEPGRSPTAGVFRLEPDTVDRLFPSGEKIVLRAHIAGDPSIFGPGAGLVRSDALIRLEIDLTGPSALLALGSRQPEQFQPGQGTELLGFLAGVVETSIRGWLSPPR